MKTVDHADGRTTAGIYICLGEVTMRQASVDLGDAFKAGAKGKSPKRDR